MKKRTATPTRPGRPGSVARAVAAVTARVHAGADARARAAGWSVTVVPGPLGLHGRAYRDPRFTAGSDHARRAGAERRAP
jgi:hypothetical protein